MIATATYISIVIGIGSLVWGYAQVGFDSLVRWLLFFGAAWLFARRHHWWWFSTLGLILCVSLAAFGMWFGLIPGWMLSSGIFALIAWHLTDFRRRTRLEKQNEEMQELERRRLGRVTLMAIGGLSLASLTMWILSALTIEWILLVAVILFLGLLQLVLWLPHR